MIVGRALLRDESLETVRVHSDGFQTTEEWSLAIVVVRRKGVGKLVCLIRIEQIPDGCSGNIWRGNPVGTLTVELPSLSLVLVGVEHPDLVSVITRQSLDTLDGGTSDRPHTHLSLSQVGTRSLDEVSPVTTLDQVETVLKSVVLRTEVVHVTENSVRVRSGVEVVPRVPVILTAKHGLGDRHVEVLI